LLFHLGPAAVRPAGFFETIAMFRSATTGDTVNTRFGRIPLQETPSEMLFSAGHSRIQVCAEAGNLTVYQNLKVFGLIYDVKNLSRRIESLLAQFELGKFRNLKAGVLSSGEQTRLCLAKAMLNEPHLLLLDEPTASLDPATARDIRTTIREFATRGLCGVLWTSHNMYEVEDVCDRVLFLSGGKILIEGDPKTLPRAHGKETLEELFIAMARE